MRHSLFKTGIVPRLIAAIAFATVAFALVALVNRTPSDSALPESSNVRDQNPARQETALHIELESVHPVASWGVYLDGVALAAAFTDSHRWEATAKTGAGTLLIETTALADAGGTSNALRIRTQHGTTRTDRTEWCSATCSIVVQLGQPFRTTRGP